VSNRLAAATVSWAETAFKVPALHREAASYADAIAKAAVARR